MSGNFWKTNEIFLVTNASLLNFNQYLLRRLFDETYRHCFTKLKASMFIDKKNVPNETLYILYKKKLYTFTSNGVGFISTLHESKILFNS